ncbi:glycosyltransferase family protein [Imperialibacter roseus]|uniref:hypothetical protein n=1 Tax=Imperialibacter roseus TaxID=1324217 RepID=UPI00374ECB72
MIIVDNSCDRAEKEQLMKAIPAEMVFFTPKNLGYAGGNNFGMNILLKNDAITAIALLNPDVRIVGNTFEKLNCHLQKDDSVAAVGPRLCLRDNVDVIYSDGGFLDTKSFFAPRHLNFGISKHSITDTALSEVDYVNGSFIIMNASVLRSLGNFIDKFFLYFEETEWCYRAKKMGWKVLVDTSCTVYQSMSNHGMLYEYYITRNRILFNWMYNRKYLPQLVTKEIKDALYILVKGKDQGFLFRIKYFYTKTKAVCMGAFRL